ncbi:hypothetical protein MHBO_004693, partial [Bonamia ostreae]
MEDVSGGGEAPEDIRNKLQSLTGDGRLDASAVKNIPPTAWGSITGKPNDLVQDASYVHTDNNFTTSNKTKLASVETGSEVNDSAIAITVKLESLSADDRLDASAIKNLPTPGTGVNEFTQLTDTPTAYTGAGGKFLAVKSTVNGVEFVDVPTGTIGIGQTYGDYRKGTVGEIEVANPIALTFDPDGKT